MAPTTTKKGQPKEKVTPAFTTEQLDIVYDYMLDNPDLARGKRKSGKNLTKKIENRHWDVLMNKLEKTLNLEKTLDQVNKFWADSRTRLKKLKRPSAKQQQLIELLEKEDVEENAPGVRESGSESDSSGDESEEVGEEDGETTDDERGELSEMSNRTIGIAEQSNDALADIAAVLKAMLRQMRENAQNAANQEKIYTTLCENVTSAVFDLCAAINSIVSAVVKTNAS
ncbi:hypothetical protein QAD02_000671 [Eretmocerus hayati]|uniref:Uncharacterized protein n=1 Tax=Eretmocerus hayati TaxID=131215 RepID=A0ACC2NE86_9HYME|nr:hypothetical protein QAD02_000671 [Eretmocerus hayati]